MENKCKNDDIAVKAFASGSTATSGKIVARYKGVVREIPAVVFTESEVERLFDGVVLLPNNPHIIRPQSAFENIGLKIRALGLKK